MRDAWESMAAALAAEEAGWPVEAIGHYREALEIEPGHGGALLALAGLIDRHHVQYLQEQLERGGLLLWVRTEDAEHEKRAREILERYSARDMHVHDLPVVGHPTEGGVSYDLSFMKTLGM